MNEKFRWAYIGAGTIAKQTASAITRTKRHDIVAVYNRTFSKAEKFAKRYGAKACRTIEEAVARPDVQGVYIATTANCHYEAAKACLALGKPVLLEKPFTVNRAQADELVKIAGEKGVYLAEAMWTWFSPVARQVKTWVQSGAVGTIQHIDISYAMPSARFYPRLLDPNLGGGALLDVGVYPITYLYNLLGKPEKISCEGVLEGGVDVDETVTLRYPDGFEVSAPISIVKYHGLENLVITGTNGRIECFFFHMAGRAKLIAENKKTVFKGRGGYGNEFDLVSQEILSGKTLSEYVPLQSTLDVMEIMDECRRQMDFRYPFE